MPDVDAVRDFTMASFADVIGEMDRDATALTGLSCIEADHLAVMLAVHGYEDAAAWVLVLHCSVDEAGDEHGRIGAPVRDREAVQLAEAYVSGMVESVTAAYG